MFFCKIGKTLVKWMMSYSIFHNVSFKNHAKHVSSFVFYSILSIIMSYMLVLHSSVTNHISDFQFHPKLEFWKKEKRLLTPTWFEHAAFWSGVRRATIAPRSRLVKRAEICLYKSSLRSKNQTTHFKVLTQQHSSTKYIFQPKKPNY